MLTRPLPVVSTALALLLIGAAAAQDTTRGTTQGVTQDATGAIAEGSQRTFPFVSAPPERARVTVNGETFDVALDGLERRSPEGRTVSATYLPTRLFELEGAFAFEFPRDWACSGAQLERGGAVAWWTIGTEGTHMMLRRFTEDPAQVLAEYRANSEATGATDLRASTLLLDGRRLEGFTMDVEGGTIGHGPRWDWTHEVYAFEQDGAGYLMVLMVGHLVPDAFGSGFDPLIDVLDGIEIVPVDDELQRDGTEQDAAERAESQPEIDPRAQEAAEQSARLGALGPVVASLRWSRAR